MVGTIIFIIILHLLFIILLVYAAISMGPENERNKELLEVGEPITCRVIKLKYRHHRRIFFLRTGDSDVKVEFTWKGELKRLEAIGSVPNDVYKIGDSIKLLYLEKYPKAIIIPGTETLSDKWVFISRIIFVIFAIILAVSAVTGIREAIREGKSRKRIREFMEIQMASEDYAGQYDEIIKAFGGTPSK